MASTALFPGSYKPPHIGHYLAAKIASQTADKVIVFVGSATRDGITQDMAVDLWELYTLEDDKIEIRVSEGSPVTDVYDFIEFEAKDGDIIYFIKGDKDVDDPRFKNVEKYAKKKKKKIKIRPIDVEDQFSRSGEMVSGTLMRKYIDNNDKELKFTANSKDLNDSFLCACVQHEIDHLDGITMFDREFKQEPIKRKNKKIGRNHLVTIKRNDAVKVLKYKKAEMLLEDGWILQD